MNGAMGILNPGTPELDAYQGALLRGRQEEMQGLAMLQGLMALKQQQEMNPLKMQLLAQQVEENKAQAAQRAAATTALNRRETALAKLQGILAKPNTFLRQEDALEAVRQADARGEQLTTNVPNQAEIQGLLSQIDPQHYVTETLRQQRPTNPRQDIIPVAGGYYDARQGKFIQTGGNTLTNIREHPTELGKFIGFNPATGKMEIVPVPSGGGQPQPSPQPMPAPAGDTGAGEMFGLTGMEGVATAGGAAPQAQMPKFTGTARQIADAQNRWIAAQNKPTLNLTGGRESVYVARMILGGNQAAKDLANVVQLPLTASTGFFGGRKQGSGLLDAGKEVLANTVTGQEAQSYNAMATGFQRSLAQIESAGLMPSGSLTHQMDAVLFKEGDTNLTKMHKLAQTRQIVEAGMEVIESNPRVSPEEKVKTKNILESIRKSVPFTHSDLIKLQVMQETNPSATLKDVLNAPKEWKVVR